MNKTLKAELEKTLISGLSEVGTFCANFDETDILARRCRAFPRGIPLEIWCGENQHTQPYDGDHGIRFEHFQMKEAT